jgi:hypothetical protein
MNNGTIDNSGLIMRVLHKQILLIVTLLCFEGLSLAQTDNKLSCVALVKKDSVVLRWVPTSIPVWQIGVKYGYVIKRYKIAKGGVFIPDGLSNGEVLNQTPVKPISNEDFDKLALIEPRSSVVQEAIYGTEFQPITAGNNFSGFMKAYNELEVRFGFALFMCDLSPVLARAAGLQFTDKNVSSDERYAYSISLTNVPDGMQVDPAIIVLDAGLITKLPPVTDVQTIFLDKAVKFQWPIILHKGTFTAYILEKSTDGVKFSAVSDLPLVNLSENVSPDYFVYTDSLTANNEQTWYRVMGISPFGEESPASEVVKGKGAPEFTAYAVIDTAEVIDNKKIVVNWRVTESKSAPVTGITILRSDKADGMFENLTPKPMSPNLRTFTDNHPGVSNYYKVVLNGRDNLTARSFPYLVQTEDNNPPSPPQMLTGKVDSSGIVTIAWKANTEPDLLGYKVFRANSRDEEFISLVRNITSQNICLDTINLNTLTHKIFYQVIAIDKRYNSSYYSAVLELTRPDTIAPAPAIITRIDANNGKVTIHIQGSPSSDISLYELYRIAENDTIQKKIIGWKEKLPLTFDDIPERQGISYKYSIKTIDFAGNSSEFRRTIYVPGSVQKSIILKAEQEKNGKSIQLSWNLPQGFKPAKTIIYRSKDKEPISIYNTIDGADQKFLDSDIEMNTKYNYRIKVFVGNSNEIVNSVQILIKPLLNSFSEEK